MFITVMKTSIETLKKSEDHMAQLWLDDQDEFYRLLRIASALKAGIKPIRVKRKNR